jgi:hypothetical protein
MAVSITPKGNRLFSGRLTIYEEQLFYKRINAGPKTIARPAYQGSSQSKPQVPKVKRPS